MKIWMFNQYAVTPNLSGGTRHFDFGSELVKRGHSVTIFASSFHYSLLQETKKYNHQNYIHEKVDGVNFIWIKTTSYKKNDWQRVVNMLCYSVNAYKIAKKIIVEKPDILLGSSVHLFAVYISYLLSKRFQIPFIMEIRDLWPQTLIDMGMPRWHPMVVLFKILEQFLCKKASKIITLLPNANQYLTSIGVPSHKVTWISNGVSSKRLQALHPEKYKDKKDSQQFTLTYTGAIGRANNLIVALKAAKLIQSKYAQIKILLVGDGAEKNGLLRFAQKNNIHNVEFIGQVPKDQLIEIFHGSDAFYFNLQNSPVFKYGISSNKLFDYFAGGKPIIFSTNSSNNPVAEAEAGLTVAPDQPKILANTIIKLYKMPAEKKNKMSENGRNYVGKNFSIPMLTNKLEYLIKSVLVGAKYEY